MKVLLKNLLFITCVLVFFTDVPARSVQKVKPYFLVITDFHFDPLASCEDKNNKPCHLIEELMQAPPQQWRKIFEKHQSYDHHYRAKDPDFSLFQSALEQVKKTHPKFVIVLGDFYAHRFEKRYQKYSNDPEGKHYRQFVAKTMAFEVYEMRKHFSSTTPIYSVLGNNDSYGGKHCQQPDYCIIPNGQFYHDISRLWMPLFVSKNNIKRFQKTFPKAGYYSVNLPGAPDTQLVLLNSVLFYKKIQGVHLHQAAQEQMRWLEAELKKAAKNKKRVLLGFHMPIGINTYNTIKEKKTVSFWKDSYSRKFRNLMHKYHNEVAAILMGHIHVDAFRLIHFHDGKNLAGVITPGISPIYGNNPAYKLFTYERRPFYIVNYKTFYLPVYPKRLTDLTQWQKEYNFNKVYQPHCHECRLQNGIRHIHSVRKLSEKYIQYYAVSTTNSPIYTKRWAPYYLCSINNIRKTGYRNCIKNLLNHIDK